jgi:hypothetical protein
MNTTKQTKTVQDILAVFTRRGISKLDSIALMEVVKFDLLRQSSIDIPIPQQGDIA